MSKLYYSLYNENLLDDEGWTRLKTVHQKLFHNAEELVFLGIGKLNPDKKIVNFEKLDSEIKKADFNVIVKASYELVASFSFDQQRRNAVLNIMSNYANNILVKLTDKINVEDLVKLNYKKGFFKDSRFTLLRNQNLIVKGMGINNIQHILDVCFDKTNDSLMDFFDTYIEASQDYNLGLEGFKKLLP